MAKIGVAAGVKKIIVKEWLAQQSANQWPEEGMAKCVENESGEMAKMKAKWRMKAKMAKENQ